MPRIITLDEKLAVIDDWLNGESRNEIAIKTQYGKWYSLQYCSRME